MNKFTSEDHDYIQSIIHLMETVLKLRPKIVYTLDLKLFNSYSRIPTVTNKHKGAALPNENIIWLNEKQLKRLPKTELIATITHELLHIKYPKASEKRILKMESDLISSK